MIGRILGRPPFRRQDDTGPTAATPTGDRVAELEALLRAISHEGAVISGTAAEYDAASGELTLNRNDRPEQPDVARYLVCSYDRDAFERALDDPHPAIPFRVGAAEDSRWYKFAATGVVGHGRWQYAVLIALPSPGALADGPAKRERLMRLGSMASALGHELKQPLSTISFAAENGRLMLVGAADTKSQKALQKFDRILEQIDRARDITNRLMDRSHDNDQGEIEFELGDALRAVQQLCRTTANAADIQLVDPILPSPVRLIGIPRGSVEQVIQNAFQNAIEAIREARAAGIAARGRVETVVTPLADGGIRIEVIDDGNGIDPAAAARVFEPFVTTKAKTGGSGIGLFISRQLVERLGGHLVIGPNTDGRGARLTVTLPPNRVDIHGKNGKENS